MKFEELPNIPKIWIDFISSKLSLVPGPLDIDRICAVAESAAKACSSQGNLSLGSGSVAVVANLNGNLFGGPVSQILKCLTAIKVCEELKQQGIAAAPVCWIHSELPRGCAPYALQLLDRNNEIHRFASENTFSLNQIAEMLAEIEQIGAGSFDAETLEWLKDSFGSCETLAAGNAQWMSALMKEWGMIVLNSESPAVQKACEEAAAAVPDQKNRPIALTQSRVLPVAVFIADPQDIAEFVNAVPVYETLSMAQPLVWPCFSATIIDSRSRRTLDRYRLDFLQLFAGEAHVLEFVKKSITNEAPEILRKVKAEAEASLLEMGSMAPSDKKFHKIQDRCRQKILYQLDKLHRHAVGAANAKEQTATRKIHRACNFLAPNGHVQEMEIGGIQIPLRYARAGLQAIYEKLNTRILEHQLIELE
jgi:uncharacterized protein YllA (UPF0747 family)